MSGSASNSEFANTEDAYYAVLNVSKYASQQEINERYRSLSLTFHPDKHSTRAVSREVATEQFLLLQKAYQVLSDPFLRQLYDELGEEGISVLSSDRLRTKSESEFNAILQNARQMLSARRLKNDIITLRGSLNCTINAMPIISNITSTIRNEELDGNISDVGLMASALKYSLQKRVNQSTVVGLTANVTQLLNGWAVPAVYGTVKHQFSPRLSSSLRVSLLSPFMSKLSMNYSDGQTFIGVEMFAAPALLHSRRPTFNASIGRRLSRTSLMQGILQIQMRRRPALSFLLSWPSMDVKNTDGEDEDSPLSHSFYSLDPGVVDGSFGISFQSARPELVGEIGATFYSLATRIGSKISLGFRGASISVFARWTSPTTEINAATIVSLTGVLFRLELSYMQQRLTLPVVLSAYYDPWASFFGVVIPSTTAILAYHFVLRPRNRKKRLREIRETQQASQEDSELRRKQESVHIILKDVAKRQTESELAVDGLIIQSASYGPRESDSPEAAEFFADVTIPVQALVRKSQLYISSGDTKSNIPGFIDPAPTMSKMLRMRYLFRGQPHYAEVPDYIPVVLPLEEHRSNV